MSKPFWLIEWLIFVVILVACVSHTSFSHVDQEYEERNGLLTIEMESAELSEDWQLASAKDGFLGKGYIEWIGEQYLNETGHGVIKYPIKINTVGTYKFTWRMSVGKGDDVTDHNDTWLKIEADDYYAERADGHRVKPKPDCETLPEFDCPEGSTLNGFFKVYGQDLDFVWQANTSDNDGHLIYARFDKAGNYDITINARSSHCQLDRMVLQHTDMVSDERAFNVKSRSH